MVEKLKKQLFDFKKILSVEAFRQSLEKTEDLLVAELLMNILESIPYMNPHFFNNYLSKIINSAVSLGWKASKSFEDFIKFVEKFREEAEKEKYSNPYG